MSYFLGVMAFSMLFILWVMLRAKQLKMRNVCCLCTKKDDCRDVENCEIGKELFS